MYTSTDRSCGQLQASCLAAGKHKGQCDDMYQQCMLTPAAVPKTARASGDTYDVSWVGVLILALLAAAAVFVIVARRRR